MVKLVLKNEIKEILSSKEALPKEWVDFAMFATNKAIKEKPDTLLGLLKLHWTPVASLRKIANTPGGS